MLVYPKSTVSLLKCSITVQLTYPRHDPAGEDPRSRRRQRAREAEAAGRVDVRVRLPPPEGGPVRRHGDVRRPGDTQEPIRGERDMQIETFSFTSKKTLPMMT